MLKTDIQVEYFVENILCNINNLEQLVWLILLSKNRKSVLNRLNFKNGVDGKNFFGYTYNRDEKPMRLLSRVNIDSYVVNKRLEMR